ncbi:hypothetical protein CK203_043070 [Vitis vinifera]|uniref:Uncharacterized protein n=1 Tax=Vitis vinifera TaxID=29760 RepID=A0A438GXB2_VITVI|nr:hypothetical protein CK203_043070 [Vitis vinifera]
MNLEERLRSAIPVWRRHSPIGEGRCGAAAGVNLMWTSLPASSAVRLMWHFLCFGTVLVSVWWSKKALQVSSPLRRCNASLGDRKDFVLALLQAFLATPLGRALFWRHFSALPALGTTPLGTDKPSPTPLQPPLLPNHSKPNPTWPNDGLVKVLNDTNFKKWKEHVIIVLRCTDLDYALRENRRASTAEQKAAMEKWERSNRTSLMIMKHSIPEAIRGATPEETRAKTFLDQIANQFAANEKVETNTILSKLVFMRYKGKENIREYIMEMSNLVTRLKALKLELSEDILVHLVLISLLIQFSQFKISYNTQKKKWTLNELIAQCVQEDERLKQEKIESARLASISQGFAIVPIDTWWIDTGATTHISVTMQGCLRSRMPIDGEDTSMWEMETGLQ